MMMSSTATVLGGRPGTVVKCMAVHEAYSVEGGGGGGGCQGKMPIVILV